MKKAFYICCVFLLGLGINTSAVCAPLKKITDVDGRVIEVPGKVQRVVVLNSNALEALMILNSTSAVVGVFSDVDQYEWLSSSVKSVPKIGKWNAPNMEVISELAPDVILTYRKNPSNMLEKQAALFGIRVVRLDLHNLDTFNREFVILAQMLGKEKEAKRFLMWKQKIDQKGDQIVRTAKKEPTLYVENFAAYKSLGKGSAGYEMMTKIGAKSITANFKTPYPVVGDEWLLEKNPEMIIKVPGGKADEKSLLAIRKQMEVRPMWKKLSAVQKEQVGVLHTTLFSGPRGAIGRLYLLKWLHPDESDAIDPEAIHKEYYRKFLHKLYTGTWVLLPQKESKTG